MDSGEGGLEPEPRQVPADQPAQRHPGGQPASRNCSSARQTWIARLDKSDTDGTGVKVYRVRYGDARQIAALLNDMFIGRGGSAARSTARSSQIAPGAGIAARRRAPRRSRARAAVPSAALRRRRPAAAPAASATRVAGGIAAAALRPAGADSASGSAARRRPRQRRRRRRRPRHSAERAHHRRRHQQFAADLRQPGNYRIIEQTLQPDRPAAAAGRDRCDHRRGHAQRQAELRRAVLPASSRRRRRCQRPTQRLGADQQPSAAPLLGRVASRFQFPDRLGGRSRASFSTRCTASPTSRCCPTRRWSCSTTRPRPCRSATRCRSRPAPRRADRQQHRRQHHRLPQHRHHPARACRASTPTAMCVLDIEQEISNVAAGSAGIADADDLAAPGQELDRGRQRPDRAAGGPDQRDREPQRAAAFRCSIRSPASATCSRTRTTNAGAHRADHLHPAADHPRRRRCQRRRGGTAHQDERAADRLDQSRARRWHPRRAAAAVPA